MLVLSRFKGERIVIGDEIELTVLAFDGGRVKLGISAPREVPILRGEIEPRDPSARVPAGGDSVARAVRDS